MPASAARFRISKRALPRSSAVAPNTADHASVSISFAVATDISLSSWQASTPALRATYGQLNTLAAEISGLQLRSPQSPSPQVLRSAGKFLPLRSVVASRASPDASA